MEQRIGQFDQVQIVTTKNVCYLSAPPDVVPDPSGVWSVAAIINDSEVLLIKKNATIRIPMMDVLKIAEFELNNVFNRLGRLSNGEDQKRNSNS